MLMCTLSRSNQLNSMMIPSVSDLPNFSVTTLDRIAADLSQYNLEQTHKHKKTRKMYHSYIT